jgi:RNA polymerase sigma factor (sigma-70 family)
MQRVAVTSRPVSVWEGLEELREGLRVLLLRHSSDENEVEDVIQETFLRAARYRRGHQVKCLRPWVMRIALNVLADTRRRIVRTEARRDALDVDETPARPAPSAADDFFRLDAHWLDGEAAQDLVGRTLGRLREPDQRLLDSFYGGGRKTETTAEECGLPRRVVKVRLYRARQRLLHLLRRRVAQELRAGRLAS